MRRYSCFILLIATVALASGPAARADYLEVRRPALLKSGPSRSSETRLRLQPQVHLQLLRTQQRSGYYSAEDPVSGTRGWVYRTFVRRYPGELPVREAEPDDGEDDGGAGRAASGPADAAFEDYRPYDPNGRWYVYGGLPKVTTYPHQVQVLRNTGYVVGHCDTRENPAWTCYRAYAFDHEATPARPSRFKVDERTASRVNHDDYTNTGYARGHMAPNYAIFQCYGRTAQLETFLTSNICPQFQRFNGGVWESLEEIVADGYAYEYGEVWVIAGPIYDNEPELLPAQTEIPDAFFMIVVDEDAGVPRALAFRFEHTNTSGGRPEDGLTTVDTIEAEAGFDFLSELPDQLENQLEAGRATQVWPYTLRNTR
jgi:endonuclease G